MSDAYETLLIEREDDGLVCLTLNRPDSLNAMNPQLVEDLNQFIDSLFHDEHARVVLIRGAGRGFCAGLDLKETTASPDRKPTISGGLRGQRRISEIVMKMRRVPQVFVACVHGPACGGGFALALASDVRIAGESVRMNAAFIRIGLSACDVGVSYFLPRLVGASLASELLLTGKFIDAERALATGLVSQVVPDEKLEAAGRATAQEILANSPIGVRLTKECLNHSIDAGSLDAAIAMEDRNQILATRSEDFREGISAFLEKRPPRYQND
ncbi:MAG: enoyl-CoA hydratase/isomerase family protein [bacterium]|nr:enoyl-CoA hydratase/isomerase family protein [bacterium]